MTSRPQAAALGLQESSFRHLAPPPDRDALATAVDALNRRGGLVRAVDLARLLDDRRGFVALADLLRIDEVFGLVCDGVLWIPMFQFDMNDLSVRPAVGQVIRELASFLDGVRTACWFTRPNAVLADRRPVDVLRDDGAAVLRAARLERFLAER